MAYTYYTSIEIKAAAVGANESNFPVVLILTDSRFATTANDGHIQNTDATGGASGGLTVPADFVVSPNSDGSSPYDFEFVDYTATTGYMELWVEITSLSSGTNTTVYLCYGDSGVAASQENVAGTWGNSYEAVYHLGEASGTIYDSTGTYNLSAINNPTYGATGALGDCMQFDDGDTEYLEAASAIVTTQPFTNEVWFRTDDLAVNQAPTGIGHTDGVGYFTTYFAASDDKTRGQSWDGTDLGQTISTDALLVNTWRYIVYVEATATSRLLYTNGSDQQTDNADVVPVDIDNFTVACLKWENQTKYPVSGLIDEVRVSSAVRDSDWVLTTYKNQDAPGPNDTFWTALASEVIVSESVCWGHITGVVEDTTLTFDTHWTGTGDIERAGDDEQIALSTGENMESGVVNTGLGLIELEQNFYQAGDDVTLKYRHGATLAACEAAAYGAYTVPFDSLGFVQVRLESTL